jgi:hypothetical protein
MCNEVKFEEINKVLNDVAVDVAVIKTKADNIAAVVEENRGGVKGLVDTVKGNESSGLLIRTDRIERWIENRVWFERIIIGAVVIQVIISLMK